jgi:butyryl-CoA dehydrogenase
VTWPNDVALATPEAAQYLLAVERWAARWGEHLARIAAQDDDQTLDGQALVDEACRLGVLPALTGPVSERPDAPGVAAWALWAEARATPEVPDASDIASDDAPPPRPDGLDVDLLSALAQAGGAGWAWGLHRMALAARVLQTLPWWSTASVGAPCRPVYAGPGLAAHPPEVMAALWRGTAWPLDDGLHSTREPRLPAPGWTVLALPDWTHLLWPAWHLEPGVQGQMEVVWQWYMLSREVAQASLVPPPLGLRPLQAWTVGAGPASWQALADPDAMGAALWRELILKDHVGTMTVATASVGAAWRESRTHVQTRHQGGQPLIYHDAVQGLIAQQDMALQQARRCMQAWRRPCQPQHLPALLRDRCEVHRHLVALADAAIQVQGAAGYLRQSAAARAWTDQWTLRQMAGGVRDALRLAYLCDGRDETGITSVPCGQRTEAMPAGLLPPEHPLSPARTTEQLRPLAAWLARAPDGDLWQQDTERLPRPLARLRRRARQFAQTHLQPHAAALDRARTASPGALGEPLSTILAEAGRQGWLSTYLPWPLGRMAWRAWRHAVAWQAALVVEEFGAVDGGLMQVLSAHHLGSLPVLLSGRPTQVWRTLRPLYRACHEGQPALMAYAITEPLAGSDVEHGAGAATMSPGVVARRVPGGWRLNGRKCYVSGGDLAQAWTVFAAQAGQDLRSWTCFVVRDQPGVTRLRNEDKLGLRASGTTELVFDEVWVPDADVIGEPGQGWAINRSTLTFSRIPVGAMALGMARSAVQIAVQWARTPDAWGQRPIDRQDVQLELAALVSEVRAMRAALWHEARHAWHPGGFQASWCKAWATERAQAVVEQALDLVGEWGVLAEAGLERVLRDVRVTRIFEGTTDINRLSLMESWAPEWAGRPLHQGPPGV